jgi:hypothetical protein
MDKPTAIRRFIQSQQREFRKGYFDVIRSGLCVEMFEFS